MSSGNDLLDGVVRRIQGINPALAARPVPVVKRKAPKREETLDPPTQYTVSIDEDGLEFEYIAMGQGSLTYPVEITLISSNEGDFLQNLPEYIRLHEAVLDLFTPKNLPLGLIPGVANVWDVRVRADQRFIDRGALYRGLYDLTRLLVHVKITR